MEVGGEGGQARQDCKVLCLRSSDMDHKGRGKHAGALLFWSRPSGFLCEHKPSVVGGEFFADVGKRVRGGDAVHKKLCSGRVQVDSSGPRNEVEELGDFAVKRGSPNHLHGSKRLVVGWVAFNALDDDRVQGTIYAFPDGNKWGGEGGAVSFDNETALAKGEALLG